MNSIIHEHLCKIVYIHYSYIKMTFHGGTSVVAFLFLLDFWFALFRKDQSSCLLCCAILDAAIGVYVPFPLNVLDTMWNSIVSVPDNCPFICFFFFFFFQTNLSPRVCPPCGQEFVNHVAKSLSTMWPRVCLPCGSLSTMWPRDCLPCGQEFVYHVAKSLSSRTKQFWSCFLILFHIDYVIFQ